MLLGSPFWDLEILQPCPRCGSPPLPACCEMPYTCEGCGPAEEACLRVNSPGIRRGRGGFTWKDVSGNEVAKAELQLEGGGEEARNHGGIWNRSSGLLQPCVCLGKGGQGGRGCPEIRGCPRYRHVPCPVVIWQWFALLRQESWVTNWELSKEDLGKKCRQLIGALLTRRTSRRENALAKKFRLVLGTGPGAGRWNNTGCCRRRGTQEARRWQSWLCLLSRPLGSSPDLTQVCVWRSKSFNIQREQEKYRIQKAGVWWGEPLARAGAQEWHSKPSTCRSWTETLARLQLEAVTSPRAGEQVLHPGDVRPRCRQLLCAAPHTCFHVCSCAATPLAHMVSGSSGTAFRDFSPPSVFASSLGKVTFKLTS